MDKSYDIGIIGGGIAGAFAALRLAEHHKKKKCILFELGRPPAKRRRQLEGWFGCFPFGDGMGAKNSKQIKNSQAYGVINANTVKNDKSPKH